MWYREAREHGWEMAFIPFLSTAILRHVGSKCWIWRLVNGDHVLNVYKVLASNPITTKREQGKRSIW